MSESADSHPESSSTLEAARRAKMARLEELGVDPWGQRFDDRTLIGDIRERDSEIVYRVDGQDLPLPDFENTPEDFNFRQWKADQGKGGEMVGGPESPRRWADCAASR